MTRALGIQLTELCAPGCGLCAASGRGRVPRSLTASAVEKALLEARALGIARVVLTGGEPLIHEELIEVIDLLLATGVEVEIVATGHRLEQREPGIRKLGKKVVRLWAEFHGAQPTHDQATRKGGFQDALGVLDLARELGVPSSARLVPTPDAIREEVAWRAAVAPFKPEIVVDWATTHGPPPPPAKTEQRCGDRENRIVAVVASSGRVFPCFSAVYAMDEKTQPLLEGRLRPLLAQVKAGPCGGCEAGFKAALSALK